ncbi:MAG: 50S ribosomal protein L23, partial [Mollicutes bacterium PWAP]|nr:50S ribosomal protein L23 [Mollicutes bacterium PWAP]
MNVNEVIKYPLLTEKTYSQMDQGIYTFVVDKRTNKVEVCKAVEAIFGVAVSRVNIQNYDKKAKKLGKFEGFTNAVKKAIVYVSEGVINIFPDDEPTIQPKSKEVTDQKADNKEISDVEKRAAEKIASKKLEESKKEESKKEESKKEESKKEESKKEESKKEESKKEE